MNTIDYSFVNCRFFGKRNRIRAVYPNARCLGVRLQNGPQVGTGAGPHVHHAGDLKKFCPIRYFGRHFEGRVVQKAEKARRSSSDTSPPLPATSKGVPDLRTWSAAKKVLSLRCKPCNRLPCR